MSSFLELWIWIGTTVPLAGDLGLVTLELGPAMADGDPPTFVKPVDPGTSLKIRSRASSTWRRSARKASA